MGADDAISGQALEGAGSLGQKLADDKTLHESGRKEEQQQSFLMWECFLNWSATLEKIDKGLIRREEEYH